MNFKIVNAKNFKMDLFIIYSLRFQSLGGTQRYKRSLLKNPRAIKLKIQEKHMTSTSLLMFSPEFSLEGELCNTCFIFSNLDSNIKFSYLQAGSGGN